jgi:hypothetical protein
MPDKFNLNGFSINENNVCTAAGGFVGSITIPEAASYTVGAPSGGDVRTFDPDTATMGELMDFVATLARDLM